MNNHRENTATYQVQTFIASEKSHNFDLTSTDIAILFVIARYLDMSKKECFGKQSALSKECRTDRFQFGRRCLALQKMGIIFRFMRGKLYHYELGHEITGSDQLKVM